MTTPYVTVTDAAGRVLFRRPATQAEIEEAIQVADAADAEAEAALKRIAEDREASLAATRAQEKLAATQTRATEPEPPQTPVAEDAFSADTFGEGEAPGEFPEQLDGADHPVHPEHEEFPADDHWFPVAADRHEEEPFQT